MSKLRLQALSVLAHSSILLGAFAAYAQPALVPGDTGAPKYGFPGPICWPDMAQFMQGEGGSSGDDHSGWAFSWSVQQQCFTLRPPALLYGPSALSSDVNLTQNAFTPLDGAVGAGGFRPGLVQYVPNGTYLISGNFVGQTAVTGSVWEIEITVGQTLGAGAQSTMLVGSPAVTGGGVCNSSSVASAFFGCSFTSPRLTCNAAYGQACEVRVQVWTSDAAGKAKAATTHLGSTVPSNAWIFRTGGLPQFQ